VSRQASLLKEAFWRGEEPWPTLGSTERSSSFEDARRDTGKNGLFFLSLELQVTIIKDPIRKILVA
jgi:hypothetical protein